MRDIYHQSIKFCLESTNTLNDEFNLDLSPSINESTMGIHWSRFLDAIAVNFDNSRSKDIIQQYIDTYRVEDLKDYLFALHIQANDDLPSDFLKRFYYSISTESRKSFYENKRKISALIIFGEAGINKIQGNKFVASTYFKQRLAKLDTNAQAKEVMTDISGLEDQNAIVSYMDKTIRPMIVAHGVGSFIATVFDLFIKFLNVGVNVLGWVVKIIIGILATICVAWIF